MKLMLQRDIFNPDETLGKLHVDGVFECFILEDTDRKLEDGGEKIYGRTAIPRGTYRVVLSWSARFKRILPEVLGVRTHVGIRIHPGNRHTDTDGCLLPGDVRDDHAVRDSRAAFNRLFGKLQAAERRGEKVTLEVK